MRRLKTQISQIISDINLRYLLNQRDQREIDSIKFFLTFSTAPIERVINFNLSWLPDLKKIIHMKITGFTFAKNTSKLYIPVKPSIESVLPIVDEFVVLMGDNDADDTTEDILKSIDSPKLSIHRSVWDKENYKGTVTFAHQTDLAKDLCNGDWLFYIQADEVLHEKYHARIVDAIKTYNDDKRVEGFLFQYKHFWGDYWHYHSSYGWYPREIRIIRNDKDIHSWRDAQSFRKYTGINYSMQDYTGRANSRKLNVIELDAEIYHYGGSRPPELMTIKRKGVIKVNFGTDKKKSDSLLKGLEEKYDYGPLDRLKKFEGTHPAPMKQWIDNFYWKKDLQYSGPRNKNRPKFKHERLKYILLTPISRIWPFRDWIGFRNYRKI